MWRTMRMAALTLAGTLAMSGAALAQRDRDDDGYYRDSNAAQTQNYGYQNGYRDGVEKGRHEGREHDPFDYQTPDWRQATRGYERWMGPVDWYQRGYQEGYSSGFRSGYEEASGRWRDGDRDRDGSRQQDDWRTGYGSNWGSEANRIGYEDGVAVARADIEHNKRYNSKPRGRFDDRDHGYRREFGSKDRYKAEYTAGYRSGYDAVMRNGY
jgi:hypothetical protein